MLNFNKSLLLSLSCLILLTACTLTVEPDDDTIDDDKTVDVDVDITNIQTNGAPNIPDDAGYDSFHAVAEDSNNSTINILTLPALAVQSTNGTSKSISKILDPVAQITFNESNVLTGASIYVGDNNHTISGTGTDTSLWQQADDGLYINATRTFARGNGDTDARYVMGIDWYQPNNSSDTIEDIIDEFGIGGGTGTRGYLVTGFETDGGQIPNNNDATFSGSGKGYYKNSVNVIIQTKFDVTANVAFANQTMNLEATNTQSCLYALSFTLCSEALNNLNFTSTLSYDAGENNLSGDVASNGMIGTTQARFYGNGDDAATELGGTFLMSGSSRYYHGYFLANTGSYAGDTTIITPTQPIEDTITKPTEDFKGIAGFNDANRNGVTDIALPVSVVEVNYRNNLALVASYSTNIPTNNKINDAMVEFSYDDDGNFVAVNTNNHGLKLYLDTKTYGVHDVNGRVFATDEIIGAYSPSYSSDNITSTDGDAPFYLALRRQSNSLGFTSNYMAKIGWFKIVNATTSFGYGITGFETSEDVFPVTGRKIIFKGKGRGIYGDTVNSPQELQFDVTANVNFNRRLIALKGENTCYSFDLCGTRAQFLDFKGNLIYEAGNNVLFGTLATKGDDKKHNRLDGTELTGKADARFYGPDADELGGTFSLADNNVSYIGYFGATTNAPDDGDTTVTIPSQPIEDTITKPAEDRKGITGFTDMNRNGKTGIALPVSAVEFNYDNNKPINHRITDVVVEFSYDAEGYFVTGDDDGNGLKFYFANKQYTIKNYDRSFRNDNYISAYGVDNIASTDGNSPQILGLDRDRGLLEFTSDYMAVLYWSLEDTTGEALQEEESGFYGYGITGFETKGSDIFSDSLTAAFYGRGRGQYRDATTPFSEQHVFSLTANVNFAKRIVALRGENTCRNSFTPGNCDIRQTPHLNFSGDLSYVADTNIITGTLTTTGDNDNEKLSGMADARFYGTNDDVSTELGGTFSMTNADASYIGFFGLRREYIASLDKPKSLNENGLTGFNDPNRNGTTNNVLPMANSVVIIKNSDYTTEINKITGAMAEFDYAADGKFYKYGIKLYFDDKRYSLVYAIVHSDSLYTTHNEAGSADSPAYIYITKEKTSFGDYDSRPAYYRPAYYMAMVRWLFYQSVDYEGYGYSMAGWESNGTDIPITGTDVSFTGKGEGSYYGTSDGINRYLYTAEFDVVATVNFEDAQVGITTSNTCTRSNCYDSQKRDYLNFTGTLNYTKGVNAITGAITTAGDADNPQMTGTADARFYGTGDDVATELGGTFNFTSDDAGYVGHFGALKR